MIGFGEYVRVQQHYGQSSGPLSEETYGRTVPRVTVFLWRGSAGDLSEPIPPAAHAEAQRNVGS